MPTLGGIIMNVRWINSWNDRCYLIFIRYTFLNDESNGCTKLIDVFLE